MTVMTVAGAASCTEGEHLAGPTLTDLYHLYRLPLTRLATLLLGDQADAEDAVHDAFLRLWRRHGGRTDMLDNPLAYLRVAVVNNARTTLRRRKTAREHTPPFLPHAESAEDLVVPQEHREVLDAVNALPKRQREILILRYWGDLSEVDIAATLGISRGTVKSSASRGLRNLAQLLEGRDPAF